MGLLAAALPRRFASSPKLAPPRGRQDAARAEKRRSTPSVPGAEGHSSGNRPGVHFKKFV